MAVRIHSGSLRGVEAISVLVEVDLLRRLPGVCIVGLAAGAVRESAERVRSALVSSSVDFPRKRVIVNLAPAGLKKVGASFDLPIAMGILAADGAVSTSVCDSLMFVGELSLGGELRSVRGALAFATLARQNNLTLVLPEGDARLAASVPGVRVLSAKNLAGVIAHVQGRHELPIAQPIQANEDPSGLDLSDVRGQTLARRALEISAAGAHHLMLVGPPGCGKSMLAKRLTTILPPLTFEGALEVARIHDAAGLISETVTWSSTPPFRAPHHSVTAAGLVGDRTLRPGEMSLAHLGVLFLDEAPEFRRSVLEVLRAPLEDGVVRLVRAEGAVEYPAAVTLVMACNPCPCGYRGSALPCDCSDADVGRYQRKLSGPIVDRLDLHVELEAVEPALLMGPPTGDTSAVVAERVLAARTRQVRRGQQVPNGQLDRGALDRFAVLESEARRMLTEAMTRFSMSGRASVRVVKVARTIADLDGSAAISRQHLSEALVFRASSRA